MKIAEVVATFPPYHGGMGYVCYHNARELSRLGHDVTVFTLDHGKKRYENGTEEFGISRLKTPLLYGDGGIVPQLYSALKGFDIVHLHYPFYGGAEYVYFANLLRGQQYVLSYHMDVYGDTLLKRMIIKTYDALFLKRIIRRAGRVRALTMGHLKSSRAAPFIDWDKVAEIPNGVDTEKYKPREKSGVLLDKHGLRGKTIVLFVGNLLRLKGLDLLIDSIAALDNRNIVLLVVGGGYAESEYRERVRQRSLEERVIFAGPQSPDGDLPHYYNLGDFLVLPSTLSESFGLVVLEAMASGIPVIISSLPGPLQLVDDEQNGLIAAVGDMEDLKRKIEHVALNKDERIRMGANARKAVTRKYNWAVIGKMLERRFRELVDR